MLSLMATKGSAATAPEFLIRPHMPELDSIRGIAILLVLLLHGFGMFRVASFAGIPRLFVAFCSYGWSGVELFFVLSGFLITGILLDTRRSTDYFRRFYIRRALRILPAYYGLLLFLFAISRTSWLGSHGVQFPFIALSLVYLSNTAPLFGIPMQYTVFWSLSVEEHFYLIWPMVVRRLDNRRLMQTALFVFLSVPIIRAISVTFGPAINHNFYTWCNADGLAAGAILALTVRNPLVRRSALLEVAIAVLTASVGILVLGAKFEVLQWNSAIGFATRLSFLNAAFAAILLLMILLGTSRQEWIVNVPVLRFLGEISYGLYLYHMVFFYAYEHILLAYWPSLAPRDGAFNQILLQFVVAGTLSLVTAVLSKRYFENYFLNLKHRIFAKAENQIYEPVQWRKYSLKTIA
jgi:peptidoglycan/LPS O-acetylase OafA/YrhL